MPDELSALLGEVERLRRALMCRVQRENGCSETGVDCDIRRGAGLCSCSLEAHDEVDPPT